MPLKHPTRGRPLSTHCSRGHELAVHGFTASDGRRRCRLCRRLTIRRGVAAHRARRALSEPAK